MTQEEIIDKLYRHLQSHETLQLATIEAVHRFYYDHCFDPRTERPYPESGVIKDLLQTLHCANPNWRYLLKRKLERYSAWESTNALIIDSKPKQIITLDISFLLQQK